MLISWILNTVSKHIWNNLNFINSTSKLWMELQEHYAHIDIVHLKQENYTVEVYNHELNSLWDEFDALEAPNLCLCLCNCVNGRINGERDQRKRLIQFLMGLDECYSNIKGQILLRQQLPTVVKAYTMVRQEEKQKEGVAPRSTITTILNSFSNNQRSNTWNSSNSSRFNTPNAPTSQRNVIPNTPNSRVNPSRFAQNGSEMRGTFKKGVYCDNCGKKGINLRKNVTKLLAIHYIVRYNLQDNTIRCMTTIMLGLWT